ncbi:hypothetical protein EXE59_15160 [Nocardioides eburneiflavus]|uniref:Uncharacterized protein n=1 Tax=Nocardioides eburneiflavus TaxID=2518372 RepID=A0A4Z1BV70_9ACTN|nr:hypothetical protein [Nocardioides eburneiflavus]TGN65151.1 hypothetical protein EXE59_15160 [Nocardioides eburneiflavus]
MTNSPAENPIPRVVTFTARGNAALEQLAAALVAECDGSATSIADLLEQVLEADIEDLADSLSQSAQPAPPASLDVEEIVGPSAESPDDAARRRLSTRSPSPGGKPGAPGTGIPR